MNSDKLFKKNLNKQNRNKITGTEEEETVAGWEQVLGEGGEGEGTEKYKLAVNRIGLGGGGTQGAAQ